MMDYIEAHKFSINHKRDLEKDVKCGCFYCLEIFDPKEITEWIEDTSGTAICPYCGIDSVIPESIDGEYELTQEILQEMNQRFF